MSCCLSTASDPCEVIQHIYCNKSLYGNVVRSIQKSRNARELGGLYCLCFCNPCDGSRISIKGDRVLEIFENPCCIRWCSNNERVAGFTIINAEFFASVLSAFDTALSAKADSRLYCKSFLIPQCLFPNVPSDKLKVTINGKMLTQIMFKALSSNCCRTMK